MRRRPGGCGSPPTSRWCWPVSRNTPGRSRSGADRSLGALFFENPRNTFRTGPAFVAHLPADRAGRDATGPLLRGRPRPSPIPTLVERGEPDDRTVHDDRPIAALLTTLDLPAHGEGTVVVVLGQADDRERAEAVIRKYRDPGAALAGLEETRRWWLGLMDTLRVQTSEPGVRPLPGLAEVPGARRTHLGAARVLPGQRRLRVPRPAPGLGEPDLDGPRRGAPADPPARLPAVPRGRRRPLVPSASGRPDRLRRADARLGQPPLAALGRGRVSSRRPATSRCSRSGRPTSRRSSPSSRCPPGSTGWASTPSARLGRHRLPALPEGDRPRAREADGGARAAADGHRRLERRAR